MNIDKIKYYREYGEERMFYKLPQIKEYTKAKHGYSMVTLLMILHPDPPKEMIEWCLWAHSDDYAILDDFSATPWLTSIYYICVHIAHYDELQVGNTLVKEEIESIENILKTNWDKMPTPCQDFVRRYQQGRLKT